MSATVCTMHIFHCLISKAYKWMGEWPSQYLSVRMIVFCSRLFVYKNCTPKFAATCVRQNRLFYVLHVFAHHYAWSVCDGTLHFSLFTDDK